MEAESRLVCVATPDRDSPRTIAEAMVGRGRAADANSITGMESLYPGQEKVERDVIINGRCRRDQTGCAVLTG